MKNSIQKTLRYICFIAFSYIAELFNIELYWAYDYYMVWSKKLHIYHDCRKNKYSGIIEVRTMFCKPFTNYWIEFDGELI